MLTHCNAGWLATVDWGTAHGADLQGARRRHSGACLGRRDAAAQPGRGADRLGAWPARRAAYVIVDNAGGHLMQHGEVDLVIVGTDRTTASGDVCNKIGTYLKALAARDNGVPFYVAAPSPSIDFSIDDGVREIPMEFDPPGSDSHSGFGGDGEVATVRLTPEGSAALNPAVRRDAGAARHRTDHGARRDRRRSALLWRGPFPNESFRSKLLE